MLRVEDCQEHQPCGLPVHTLFFDTAVQKQAFCS